MDPLHGADFAWWRYGSLFKEIEERERRGELLRSAEIADLRNNVNALAPGLVERTLKNLGALLVAFWKRPARQNGNADRQPLFNARRSSLELLHAIPGSQTLRTVTVIGSVGVCPWGFKVADRIDIDSEGQLSKPICRAAIDALGASFERPSGVRIQLSCICPIAGRHLTFEVQEADKVGMPVSS